VKRAIDLYGVPMDLGASRRGVDMGPSALRIAGILERLRRLGHEVLDRGNLPVPAMESTPAGDGRARYLGPIHRTCEELFGAVAATLGQGRFPLVLGGDHSLAVGTVAAVAAHYRERGERIGLIWFDAHGDMNTPETSPSGNLHGMPLAMTLGYGVEDLVRLGGFRPKIEASNCALIGVRSLDSWERELVQQSGVRVFTMKEIDRQGIGAVTDQAIAAATAGTAGFYLSLDLDGLDPLIAPGTGAPEPGGVSYREAHLMLELIADSGRLLGLECVELNPILDHCNRTAELAVELVASALGEQILPG
jgi:arginase